MDKPVWKVCLSIDQPWIGLTQVDYAVLEVDSATTWIRCFFKICMGLTMIAQIWTGLIRFELVMPWTTIDYIDEIGVDVIG